MLIKYTFTILFILLLLGCTTNKESSSDSGEYEVSDDAEEVVAPPENQESELVPKNNNRKIKEDEIIVPSPVKRIDTVYALDLETYTKPEGRVLVAGKTYEMIAENNVPFENFVRFTLVIDGNEFESLESTCPEFCAHEAMYSRSFTIPEGDYTEVTITAEDANGTNGSSVTYQYAKTTSQASSMVGSCPVDNFVPDYDPRSVPGKTLVSYGGTISEGWPEGSSPVTFEVPTTYSDICSDVKSNGPAAPYFAKTVATYEPHYEYDVTPKPDPVSCTCSCNAKPKNLQVELEVSIDFPDWTGYGSGTVCQQTKWDDFSADLKAHEEGHVVMYKSGVDTVKTETGKASGDAEGATCEEACDQAVSNLDTDFDQKFASVLSDIEKQQDQYDTNTNHGATQGATLDCGAC